jgi:hypothetical protein
LKDYDAGGSLITPMMARLVIGDAMRRHIEDAVFAMRIEQKMSVESIAMNFSDVVTAPIEDLPDLSHIPPVTFCGRPVIIDEKLPIDVIELREKSGSVIARIRNLAVPRWKTS